MAKLHQLSIPGFERIIQDQSEYEVFTRGLSNESPRAVALITLCAVDGLLEQLLLCKLSTEGMVPKRRKELSQSLKNFTSKVVLAQSLGLLDSFEADTLVALNEIRNKFAHRWDASFEKDYIVEICRGLPVSFTDEIKGTDGEEAFDRFRYIVAMLLIALIARASQLAEDGKTGPFQTPASINRRFTKSW